LRGHEDDPFDLVLVVPQLTEVAEVRLQHGGGVEVAEQVQVVVVDDVVDETAELGAVARREWRESRAKTLLVVVLESSAGDPAPVKVDLNVHSAPVGAMNFEQLLLSKYIILHNLMNVNNKTEEDYVEVKIGIGWRSNT
jgi:hypothetical protein